MTFKSLLDEMHETYKKKNADYGNSFKQTHLQFGEIAGLVRISDKVNRLISLSKKRLTVRIMSLSEIRIWIWLIIV